MLNLLFVRACQAVLVSTSSWKTVFRFEFKILDSVINSQLYDRRGHFSDRTRKSLARSSGIRNILPVVTFYGSKLKLDLIVGLLLGVSILWQGQRASKRAAGDNMLMLLQSSDRSCVGLPGQGLKNRDVGVWGLDFNLTPGLEYFPYVRER